MRLALGDHRPDPGLGVEGGNAGAARANAFGERALRIELELELSRKIEFGEKLVLDDVGRDHLTDLAVSSEEHTSALQSLMRISYSVFCLKKKKNINSINYTQ